MSPPFALILPREREVDKRKESEESMSKEDIARLKEILFDFIVRVAKREDATTAELQALPEVASVLVKIYELD